MRNNVIIAALALMMTTFTSCSNDNEPQCLTEELRQVSIFVETEAAITRSNNSEITRYTISVWEDADCQNPENIFPDSTNITTSENGNFSLTLNIKKQYFCLLWADNGTGYELGTTLKDIQVAPGSNVTEAFHGTLYLAQGQESTYSVKLTRAVAKISLLETGELPAGYEMNLSWSAPSSFNVVTASPEGDNKEMSVNWVSDKLSGTVDTPVTLKDDIFILAPAKEKVLYHLTYRCNDEMPTALSNVPIRANYKTNIKGHFTTTENVNFSIHYISSWESDEVFSEF